MSEVFAEIRRRLQRMAWVDLEPALVTWLGSISPVDPMRPRLVLESLWLHQAHGQVRADVVAGVLELDNERARAGGVRVIRHWLQEGVMEIEAALPLLRRAAADPDMRVRLEALVAAGFMPPYEGAGLASLIADAPMDDPMQVVMRAVLAHIEASGSVDSELVHRFRLEQMSGEALVAQPMDEVVATVMLTRRDVPVAQRQAALAFVAGEKANVQVSRLAQLASDTSRPEQLRAIGELLLAMPVERLETVDAYEWGEGFGPWYLAALSRLRPEAPWHELPAEEVVGMLTVLPPGEAPARVRRRAAPC